MIAAFKGTASSSSEEAEKESNETAEKRHF